MNIFLDVYSGMKPSVCQSDSERRMFGNNKDMVIWRGDVWQIIETIHHGSCPLFCWIMFITSFDA